MLYVDEETLRSPRVEGVYDDTLIKDTLLKLAKLASLHEVCAWTMEEPQNHAQRKARLWYEWAKDCVEAFPAISHIANSPWTMLRERLYYWLRLKLWVLYYASQDLEIAPVDIANHIVRLELQLVHVNG